MRALHSDGSRACFVFAPHEPDVAHVQSLRLTLEAAGFEATTMSDAEQGAVARDALIVDRVGVLADLYAIADVAYVGGGFHDQGLHSVVEPAALGVPVLFGPRLGNAREADSLATEGGGVRVDGAAALTRTLRALQEDAAGREARGRAAMRFVESRLGAAERNAALLAALVETHAARAGTD